MIAFEWQEPNGIINHNFFCRFDINGEIVSSISLSNTDDLGLIYIVKIYISETRFFCDHCIDFDSAKDWADSKLKELGYTLYSKKFDPKLKNLL